MKDTYQKQHFVSQVLLRRFTTNGHLQAYYIATDKWKRLSPKKVFREPGYTQLLSNGQIDNRMEEEFGKLETKLPGTFKALDDAAQKEKTELPDDVFENFCHYCAFLHRISIFSKAAAPVNFMVQLDSDLELGKTHLLENLVRLTKGEIEIIKQQHSLGKKVIIDSQGYLQYLFRTQWDMLYEEDKRFFRNYIKWSLWNSPIDMPISDIPLLQVFYDSQKTKVYMLPIGPRLLLAGTLKTGTPPKIDGTIIKGYTFNSEEAQHWLGAICLSALTMLATKNQIADIPGIRKRASKEVSFLKIHNIESILKAGTVDFTGAFGVRLVNQDEYVKAVHSSLENPLTDKDKHPKS